MLQANALAGFDEVLLANFAKVRIMKNQIAELRALLDKLHLRKAFHLVMEVMKTDQFAQSDTQVVKTKRLVKVTGQQRFFAHVLVLLYYLSWCACSGKPPHPLAIHRNRVPPTLPH